MNQQVRQAPALLEDLTRALEGRYVVGDAIGFGRGGVTVRARRVSSGRNVALKVAWEDRLARAQVLRETAITAKVKHANVLPMRSIDALERLLVVEMPLAAGTADDLIETGTPVPFERVVQIMTAAANALDLAHQSGIVHGGLHPAKLLIDDKNEVLLSDFSLRVPQVSARDVAKPSTVGTPAYTPMEQRRDLRGVDGRIDQFALAVIAYELLRGRRTWHVTETGALEIEPMEISSSRPIAAGVPLSASFAIKRATSRDPNFRYKSVGDFVRGLSDASAQPVASEQIYRSEPKAMRRRSPIWVILLVIALLAAGYFLRG
ncbi:MAG TPA: serine/threonine-protein kinase [Polyangia bacterium]